METRLNETEEECQSLHEVTKHTQKELQELAAKYTEAQKKLQETTNKLMESDDKLQEMTVKMEEEKKQLAKQLKDQTRNERVLQAKLQNSKLDSINVHKQVTALKNYVRTLQDAKSKQLTDDNLESKDDINDVEMSMSGILNKLIFSTKPTDNYDNMENNVSWQDNQANSEDSEEMKNFDSDDLSYKDQINDSLTDSEKLNEYILPPSNRNLFNGGFTENLNFSIDSDTNSEATEDTCIDTSMKDVDIDDSLTDSEKLDDYILPPSRRTLVPQNFDLDSDTNSHIIEDGSSAKSVRVEPDDSILSNENSEEDSLKTLNNERLAIPHCQNVNSVSDTDLQVNDEICNETHVDEINDSTSINQNDNESPSKKTILKNENYVILENLNLSHVDNNLKINDSICDVKSMAIVDSESPKKTCEQVTYDGKQPLNKNGGTLPKLEVRFASDEDGKQLERRWVFVHFYYC